MKYLGIKKKIHGIGFDDFYQAGYPNKFHPMNLVAISRVLNKQFWIRGPWITFGRPAARSVSNGSGS